MDMIILSLVFLIGAIFTRKYRSKSKTRVFVESALLVLYEIITIIYIASNYFTGEGINHTVLSTIILGLGNAGFKEYSVLILLSFFSFIFSFILAYFYYKNLVEFDIPNPDRIKAFIHNGFLILAFFIHPFFKDIFALNNDINVEQSSDFYKYYIAPETNGNGNNKNLVFIYSESFEKTYLDNNLFPDLAPNLNKLIKDKGIEFTNIHQVDGTGYTIAGMVSTQCGMPFFVPYAGNSMSGVEKFYPKAICMGDVLKDHDYYLSFLQGSSIQFSGIVKFYKTHSFDKIQGGEELSVHLQDKSYVNGWGLYDDTLLELAYKEFMDLSETQDKFAMFIATIDTHPPKGQLSVSCKDDLYKDGANPILNTFKCSDMLVSKFIKKIQESQYAKNTVIVLISDHLAMRNSASDMMPDIKKRRNLFVIFDNKIENHMEIDKKGTSFDVAPTVLSMLGINTGLGLGRNLFDSSSLFEYFENFNHTLGTWRGIILSFWEFPELKDTIKINLNTSEVKIDNQKLKLPLLAKVENNQEIRPTFQEGAEEKLYEQILWLKDGDKFLWIDECRFQNYLFYGYYNKNKDKYCVTQGIYGKSFNTFGIDSEEKYKVKSFQELDSNFVSFEELKKRVSIIKHSGIPYPATLEEGIIFNREGYPEFISNVRGLSEREGWGRWSDANLNDSVEFEFKEDLPQSFKLELVLGAYGPNIGKDARVIIGSNEQKIKLIDVVPQKYVLEFKNIKGAKKIKIVPPLPTSPASLQQGEEDERKLGLAFVWLKIIETPWIIRKIDSLLMQN